MLGAIIGDIAGSRFEWHNIKTKEFTLFHESCRFTDDSVMTLAVASALTRCVKENASSAEAGFENAGPFAVEEMQKFGRLYPNAGYGGMFARWLKAKAPQPYGSYGNGAAMRVSPCGFAAATLRQALELAERVTCVTHNHPEGLRGAGAVAAAIFLARTGSAKEEIRRYVEENYYRLDFTLDAIRPTYKFDVTCQGSVPQALQAFFESNGFEDAIRSAISIGGDSDTVAAITGGIAEAYYGVPARLAETAKTYLTARQLSVLEAFYACFPQNVRENPVETGEGL